MTEVAKKHNNAFSYSPTDWHDWENIKIKVTPKRSDPDFNDDCTKGYNLFSLIINISVLPRRVFICVDPAEGVAKWHDITSRSTGTIEDAFFKSTDTLDSIKDGLSFVKSKNNFTDEFKELVSCLIKSGTGLKFLSDDGTYKDALGFSGDYNDLANKPAIPSKMSELVQDVSYVVDPQYVRTDNNFTNTLLQKLNRIADDATKNKEDSYLLDRFNHTGVQLAETISDFQEEVSNNQDLIAAKEAMHSHGNSAALSNITNTGNGTKFLSDDGAYKEVDGGTGGTTTYTNLTPVPTTIGGITAGTTFDAVTIQQVLDSLLYPYMYPFFSAFSISGQQANIEVGDIIQPNRTFTWSISNQQNIKPDTIKITNISSSEIIASGLPNTGSYASTYPGIQRNTQTSVLFRISSDNSKDSQFTKDCSVQWLFRKWSGESSLETLSDSDVKSLRLSSLSSGFSGTYAFSTGGYKYIAYPSNLGTATTFKDQSTNLDIPFNSFYIVSITNQFGVSTNYKVHRTTNQMGSSINIVVG